jgi:hypothetical protein
MGWADLLRNPNFIPIQKNTSMKKQLLLLLLLFSCFAIRAQKETGSYLLRLNGEKMILDSSIEYGPQTITIKNKGKKSVWYEQKDFLLMVFNNRLWLCLPVKEKKMFRLQEVLFYTEKYIVTTYSLSHIYVYDWNLNKILNRQFVKGTQKSLDNYILPYAADCPKVTDLIRQNMASKKSWADELEVVGCGKKDISEIIPKLENLRLKPKK